MLVAEAEGCDASVEVDDWWPIHNAIEGGDDFSLSIPVQEFRPALESAHLAIVIIADSVLREAGGETPRPTHRA
jgi:hypothetical protein